MVHTGHYKCETDIQTPSNTNLPKSLCTNTIKGFIVSWNVVSGPISLSSLYNIVVPVLWQLSRSRQSGEDYDSRGNQRPSTADVVVNRYYIGTTGRTINVEHVIL